MKLIEDLGMKFATEYSKKKTHYGLYECQKCLKHFEADMYTVKKRNRKFCTSCVVPDVANNALKHGFSGSRIYSIYRNMLKRCYGTDEAYSNYVEAGITVCKEWLDSVEAFVTWSENSGYLPSLSLDRRDNTLGYSPDNCRWTTCMVQSRNTRKIVSTNTSGYRGVSWKKDSGKFRAGISVGGKKVHLGYFIDPLEAAIAYDTYVLENNLEHTINGVIEGFEVNPVNT